MKIIIAGAGSVGSHLAKMLSNENHQITLIDLDEDRLHDVGMNLDILTIVGSATSLSVLEEANISKTDLFISVTTSESTNINSAVLAKRMGSVQSIARVDNEEYLMEKNSEYILNMGIDYMIYPEGIAAKEIVGLLHQSTINNLVNFSHDNLHMYVLKLEEESPILNKSLIEFSSETQNENYLAVAITRDDETIIPKGNEVFRLGDTLYMIANKSGIEDIERITGKAQFDIRKVMILGASRIGVQTAKELEGQCNVKLIELDREKSYEISNTLNNTLVINGDGRNIDLLLDEGLAKIDAFVAVTGNSETNILSCLLAKKYGVRKTVAEIENMNYIGLAENSGIDTIINKKLIAASRIFRFTMEDEVSVIRCLTGTDAEVFEFEVQRNAPITKGALNEIDFPQECIIGGFIRDNQSFIAHGFSRIHEGDKVVVFSLPSGIPRLGKFFHA